MPTYLPPLSEPARRWLRFAAFLAALGLLCWLVYRLRGVFTPILIGLALAYIVNPIVTWFERARKLNRLSVVVVTFALLGVVVLSGGLYLLGKTVAQVHELAGNMPSYWRGAETWLVERGLLATATAPASAPGEAESEAAGLAVAWQDIGKLLSQHGVGAARAISEQVLRFLSSLANVVTLLVLIPMYAFFFLWRFNEVVATVRAHLPAAYRDGITHVARTIDAAVANFFRGRLIVCAVVGTLTGLGWSWCGVPLGMLLGLLAGALNLVPFMSLLALPLAFILAYVGAVDAGTKWAVPVTLTLGVYLVVQAIESFLLSPYVEGRASGLHPLVIVVALLIGAELAGLLGMLLAIPIASTLRTLAGELLMPEIRRLAGLPTGPPPAAADQPGSGPADPT